MNILSRIAAAVTFPLGSLFLVALVPRAAGDGVRLALVLAALAIGVTLAVRAVRCGVDCRPGRIIVRGYLWTRTIPLSDILTVHVSCAAPAVTWRDSRGAIRRTTIHAFKVTRPGHRDKHGYRKVGELADWVGQRRAATVQV